MVPRDEAIPGNLTKYAMRYRIDDLGWFQFEKLIQSVLKANLGLAIQSWGGHSDFGRDSFTRMRLPFPDPNNASDGPFIFQTKFVQGANAAGANWVPSLIKAVSQEKRRIAERRAEKGWEESRHYILVTNAPLTSSVSRVLKN